MNSGGRKVAPDAYLRILDRTKPNDIPGKYRRIWLNPTVAICPSRRDLFFRLLSAALVVFCVVGTVSAQLPSGSRNRFDRELVVGTPTDSYPYAYLGKGSQPEGFSIDVLDAVARLMSLKVVRVAAPSSEIADRFQRGEFDLLQSYSPGPGREAYADFSAAHLELPGSFFVRKDEKRFNQPAELGGAEVAIPGFNSIGEKFLQDNGIAARIVHTRSVEDSLIRLNSGAFDAAFAARLSALSYIELHKLRNVMPLGQPLIGYDVRPCFAVHKGDAVLIARLNEGLAILNRNGEYERIYRKWFGRFDTPVFSRVQVITYIASLLALALLATVAALVRQHVLRKRIAGQARQIAENEAILAEAQQVAHLGHWRYDVRARTISFSAEALRILGHGATGAPPSYRRVLMSMARSDRSFTHRCIRAGLKEGVSSEAIVAIRTPDGTVKVVQGTSRPLRDPDDGLSGLFGTVQDITRQKAADDALRTREQLLRALYDNVPIAMGVVEPSGGSFRFISANVGTANLLGLHSTPLAGRILAELPLPTSTVEFWTDWFQRGLEQTELFKTENLHEATRKHYAITLVPLGHEHGRRQLCFLVEDVTERKQMDTEVAQGRRLRAIGELVGGIAHEFNNLLTPIMLKAELLAMDLARDPVRLEELKTISQAARRGADLTKRLLTLGRRSESRPEQVRLDAVVRSNLDLLRPTIERRIALVTNVPASLPPLFINPADLHQIIINLLLNARDTLVEKLAQETAKTWNARITLEAVEARTGTPEHLSPTQENPTSWICLTVADNGMGMQQDVQERIFEPFYTTKEVGKGTGLGLATVWHLANRLGGKVTVDSELGVGSTFNVWLPIHPSAPEAPGRSAIAKPDEKKGTASIMLVEDDDLVAETVGMILRRAGHGVVRYSNGSEAWRHLETKRAYDLLLLDIDLPGMNGIEIARRARGAKFTGHILIASGRLSEAEVRELDALRVDGKLQKPFTPGTLKSAVQACLDGTPLPPGAPLGLSSDPFTGQTPPEA